MFTASSPMAWRGAEREPRRGKIDGQPRNPGESSSHMEGRIPRRIGPVDLSRSMSKAARTVRAPVAAAVHSRRDEGRSIPGEVSPPDSLSWFSSAFICVHLLRMPWGRQVFLQNANFDPTKEGSKRPCMLRGDGSPKRLAAPSAPSECAHRHNERTATGPVWTD